MHVQSLINIIQDNHWVITTKKGKVKLPLFRGNGEQVIPFYDTVGRSGHKLERFLACNNMAKIDNLEKFFYELRDHLLGNLLLKF